MSLFYSLISKLFKSPELDKPKDEVINVIQIDDPEKEYSDKFDKINLQLHKLNTEIKDLMAMRIHYETKINDMTQKYKELESKYEQEQLINKIIKEKYLKEPEMTNIFNALDNMTINQFKNIIPKMDLEQFPDITTKDKYLNACMYMFVRKFNNDGKYGTDEFIDYVVNNTSLTVDTREALKTNMDNVRKELGDFYEFIQLY